MVSFFYRPKNSLETEYIFFRGVGTYSDAWTGPDNVLGKYIINIVRDDQTHTNI